MVPVHDWYRPTRGAFSWTVPATGAVLSSSDRIVSPSDEASESSVARGAPPTSTRVTRPFASCEVTRLTFAPYLSSRLMAMAPAGPG